MKLPGTAKTAKRWTLVDERTPDETSCEGENCKKKNSHRADTPLALQHHVTSFVPLTGHVMLKPRLVSARRGLCPAPWGPRQQQSQKEWRFRTRAGSLEGCSATATPRVLPGVQVVQSPGIRSVQLCTGCGSRRRRWKDDIESRRQGLEEAATRGFRKGSESAEFRGSRRAAAMVSLPRVMPGVLWRGVGQRCQYESSGPPVVPSGVDDIMQCSPAVCFFKQHPGRHSAAALFG